MTVSISNLNFTWANSDNVFTAIGANVNAAAYAANSRILRLGVDDSEVFSVDTDGILYIKKVPFTGNGSITIQGESPISAYNTANAGYSQANAAFEKANSAVASSSIPAYNTANAAFEKANSAVASSSIPAYNTANAAYAQANAAYAQANSIPQTQITNYLNSLPTSLPASPGQYWWNGGVLSKS